MRLFACYTQLDYAGAADQGHPLGGYVLASGVHGAAAHRARHGGPSRLVPGGFAKALRERQVHLPPGRRLPIHWPPYAAFFFGNARLRAAALLRMADELLFEFVER